MKKKAIVSVINDLFSDQRVHKMCCTLTEMGFEVLLVGRILPNSLPLQPRDYKTKRMRLFFTKGPWFYAEFNIRLFLFLLFRKANVLVSNDLDTLLPNYLIKKIKNADLVYDSHEYFTEVPELVNRPKVKAVWESIEKRIFPKLKDIITVNESIADLYHQKYGNKLNIVRNIPLQTKPVLNFTKEELGIPLNKRIVILQGSGINIQRGAEELIEAMQFLENTALLIVGSGDVMDLLRNMTIQLNLQDKVVFIPKQAYSKLLNYTALADLGCTIDKDTNINYRISLPNKLFDYIRAEIPILSTRLTEIQKIIEFYNIGDFIDSHEPKHIAHKIEEILSDKEKLKIYKQNLRKASSDLCWENECVVVKNIYKKFL